MRYTRIIQIVVTVMFGIPLLVLLVVAFLHPERRGALLGGAIVPLFFITVVNLVLWWQRRSFTRANATILETMRGVAARVFDTPVAARDDFDGTRLLGGIGDLIRITDGSRWPAAEGTYRGAKLLVASHPSIAGRQMFEFYHVYSYVAVDAPGFSGPFEILERSKVAAFLLPGARDVKLGDPQFEQGFTVNADEALAHAVLTAPVRARLVDLRSKVTSVSVDFAQGRMSLRLTPYGITLRWPGELSVELTEYIRDLLFDLRQGVSGRS